MAQSYVRGTTGTQNFNGTESNLTSTKTVEHMTEEMEGRQYLESMFDTYGRSSSKVRRQSSRKKRASMEKKTNESSKILRTEQRKVKKSPYGKSNFNSAGNNHRVAKIKLEERDQETNTDGIEMENDIYVADEGGTGGSMLSKISKGCPTDNSGQRMRAMQQLHNSAEIIVGNKAQDIPQTIQQ